MSAKKAVLAVGLATVITFLVFNALQERRANSENRQISKNLSRFYESNYSKDLLRELSKEEFLHLRDAVREMGLVMDLERTRGIQVKVDALAKKLFDKIGTADSLVELGAIKKIFDQYNSMTENLQASGLREMSAYRRLLDQRYRELATVAVANPADLDPVQIDIIRELVDSGTVTFEEIGGSQKEFDKIVSINLMKGFAKLYDTLASCTHPILTEMYVRDLERYLRDKDLTKIDLSEYAPTIRKKIAEVKQYDLRSLQSEGVGRYWYYTYDSLIENVRGGHNVKTELPDLFVVSPEDFGTTIEELESISHKLQKKFARIELTNQDPNAYIDFNKIDKAILEGTTFEELGTTAKEYKALKNSHNQRDAQQRDGSDYDSSDLRSRKSLNNWGRFRFEQRMITPQPSVGIGSELKSLLIL